LFFSGVSFGIGGKTTSVADSILRSHRGYDKLFTWQKGGLGDAPASDEQWHFVEAKRVGSTASLSLDGLVVAVEDNVPDWSDPFESRFVKIGEGFKGWLDEVKIYKLPNARGYYDEFTGDRDGDGVADRTATNTSKAWLSGVAKPASVDMFSGG